MANDDETEAAWMRGHRAAWTAMLQKCLGELGYEDNEATRAKWILEREAAVVALRRVCERFGDNEWPDDLRLSDVIEKHLERPLEREPKAMK